MPTLEELRNFVLKTVQDPSVTVDTVDVLLNEGLNYVAEEVLLPALEKTGTVLSEAGFTVDLPADFGRELYACVVAGQQDPPQVLSSMGLLRERVPDLDWDADPGGDVQYATTRGLELFYYPAPDIGTTMTLSYYRKPTLMVQDTDTPEGIPEGMQRKLLCSYALVELYDDIEDGLEGPKTNTTRHENKLEAALFKLKEQIKKGQSRATPHRRSGWV